tara:strand:- start:855 stop:1457 length:603 start_codon:yes stop_codon:yes gene_type:complete
MQQYELNVGDIKEVKKKVTQVESSKRYYENNKEKVAARQKLYKKKNKKIVAAKAKCYYENNKEKVMAQAKIYREKHSLVSSYDDIDITWANFKLTKIKSNWKRRKHSLHLNVLNNLTAEDVISLIPKDLKCPVYKEPFIFKGRSQWNLSFDRIDNSRGYTKDNVVVVSSRANVIKNVANVKELYQVADFYYALEKKRLDK